MLGLLVEWYTEPAIRQGHAVRASFCATEAREAVGGIIELFGPHRLICGNAVNPDTVAALMNGEQAQPLSKLRRRD